MNRVERQSLIALPPVLVVAGTVSWAASQGSVAIAGVPGFALCGLLAFAINWLAFVPSFLARTERFYDITGTATYLSVVALALLGRAAADARAFLLGALIAVWALRLGRFLFARISRAGSDGRFDEIKQSWPRFLLAWTLQGLWVLLTAGCALAAMLAARPQPLGIVAVAGTAVWLAGFAIEVIADRQKSRFRADPANRDRFIRSGLWAWSRHPNYFGEIALWLGIAIIALPALDGWQHATLISPLFVYLLLTRVSGIPLLERRADERWGDDPAYMAYRDATPMLFPRPPRAAP
jgi:steroid 5-alpha reductase family enzyme